MLELSFYKATMALYKGSNGEGTGIVTLFPAYTKDRLMSKSDDKELSSEMDTIDWNSINK